MRSVRAAQIVLSLLPALIAVSDQQCQTFQTGWYGWLSDCRPNGKNLTVSECSKLGNHCAYCYDAPAPQCNFKHAVEKYCRNPSYFDKKTPCQKATNPNDCVQAGNHCAWCADLDWTKTRCNNPKRLEQLDCKNPQIIKDKETESSVNTETMASGFGLSIERATVNVRAGQSSVLEFNITEPNVYPVDLYMALDLSYSMKNTLNTVKRITTRIFKSFKEEDNVRLGFGQFIDKLALPITEMTEYKLRHPYEKELKNGQLDKADYARLFQNIANLTTDASEVVSLLEPIQVSGNLDGPEAALSAMVQASACDNLIQWRENALRILVVVTESWFHHAGDGMAKMAGFVHKNDMQCHTDGVTNMYKDGSNQDYPSIYQVSELLKERNIVPMFFVKDNFYRQYKMLRDQFFPTGIVAKFEENNRAKSGAELLKIITESITAIREKQSLSVIKNKSNSGYLCTGFQGQKQIKSNDKSVIYTDVPVEQIDRKDIVTYRFKFSSRADACESLRIHPGKAQIGLKSVPPHAPPKIILK